MSAVTGSDPMPQTSHGGPRYNPCYGDVREDDFSTQVVQNLSGDTHLQVRWTSKKLGTTVIRATSLVNWMSLNDGAQWSRPGSPS